MPIILIAQIFDEEMNWEEGSERKKNKKENRKERTRDLMMDWNTCWIEFLFQLICINFIILNQFNIIGIVNLYIILYKTKIGHSFSKLLQYI